ncbi:MAG: ABC transporter substrate-binding protein [Thermotogae bacterium]|nr:ABC transporter substrate-binding protein [Thermotogota bacterium]
MIKRALLLCLVILLSLTVISFSQLPNVPRDKLLIVDQLDGRATNPKLFNPYVPGVSMSQGTHQFVFEHIWDINTVTGEWINVLATQPPEPLDENYMKWRIHLRKGLYWSDGVEFTADDIVFTFKMLTTDKRLPAYGYWSHLVKEAKAVDKYTVDIELFKPYAKIQEVLGVVVWGCGFYPVPKHIWEKVDDPSKFTYYPPVSLGAYVLEDVDPNGYWFLWKKRSDWQRTPQGQLFGEPKPEYVLFIFYGPPEKRVLAMIQHKCDVLQDITPESWDVLRKGNKYARAWYGDFPWAWMDDPCERGMAFNCSKFPWNLKEVRWALTLATNIFEVSLSTFNGMLRFSPLHIPPINVFKEIYFEALVPWLKEFQFEDGYKPFDPDIPVRMAKYFKEKGYNVPTDEKGAKEIFGIGWWKYDPKKAEELLKKVGFKRDENGKWLLPNGKPWSFSIICPSGYEVESERLAYAVAEQWRKFGIDVTTQPVEQGTFWPTYSFGTYEVGSYWPGCGQIPDIWGELNDYHEKYIVETGKPAPANAIRWSDPRMNKIADELEKLLPTDPKCVTLGLEGLKILVEEMPFIPMVGTSKFVPVDTYYWKNWPSAENHYDNPIWWWAGFDYILSSIEPTGRK